MSPVNPTFDLEFDMSKEQKNRKQAKKAPLMSAKEKRAAKQAKKASQGFLDNTK
jgi:hypothetical protein